MSFDQPYSMLKSICDIFTIYFWFSITIPLGDIVVTNTDMYTTNISVYKNMSTPGHISFATKLDVPSLFEGDPQAVSDADIEGDGKPEIVVVNSSSVGIFKNTSYGGGISFDPFLIFYAASGQSILSSVAIKDMDGDGLLDIVIPDRNLNLIGILKIQVLP